MSTKITKDNHSLGLKTAADSAIVRGKFYNELRDDVEGIKDGTSEFDTIDEKTAGSGVTIDSVLLKDGAVTSTEVVTTANIDAVLPVTTLSSKEYGDGMHHITVLTLTAFVIGATGGAVSLAFGNLIYVLPAGAQLVSAMHMDIKLDNSDGSCDADVPDVGIGSTIGTGSITTLAGTMMDYFDAETSGVADGTNAVEAGPKGAVAGFGTGIALNASGSTKDIFLNAAEAWTASATITATGTITIVWDTLD